MNNKQLRISILEDDISLAENIESIVEGLGHAVVGRYQNLDTADDHEVDFFIVDVGLLNGESRLDFAKRVSKKKNAPGLIYLTGNMENDIFHEAKKTNMLGFLTKPFKKVDLENTIEVAALVKKQEQEKLRSESVKKLPDYMISFIHDLSNVITTCSLSFMKLKKLPQAQNFDDCSQKIISNGLTSCNMMGELIQKLRTDIREQSEEVKSGSVEELLFYCRSIIDYQLEDLQIDLKIDIDKHVFLNVNQVLMKQVFLNLLNNSICSIKEKNNKWIRISDNFVDEDYIVRITDSGMGISEDVREKIFDPFFSTNQERAGQNLGFGLYYSKCELEKKGINIRYVETEVNTCFEIIIPNHIFKLYRN